MQDGQSLTAENSTRYSSGVLFIHGIGQQKRGDTLLSFGGPLLRFLKKARLVSHETGKTIIKPDPNDPEAPAHTEISTGADGSQGCLLAESCWAESFHVPEFRDVAKWVLLALPWTLASEFARKLEPALSDKGGLLRNYPRFSLSLLSHLVVFFGGALVLVLVTFLLLLALIPIPKLREVLLMIQLRIAAIVGDSYVLLDSPITAGAIVSRVCRDLEWMARKCDRVSVVAHSQGAAVAHRTIRRLEVTNDPVLKKVNLYFSFGSGLGKLHDIQEAFKSGGWKLAAGYLLMISVLLIASALPAGLITQSEPGGWVMALYVLAYLGFCFMLIFLSIHSVEERGPLLLESFKNLNEPEGSNENNPGTGHIEWIDRYATSDPVPSGPIFIKPRAQIDSRAVHNRGSIWSDHTTYTENSDEFLRILAIKLGFMREFSCSMPSLKRAQSRRRWRVHWLTAARLLSLSTFILLVFGLQDQLAQFGNELLDIVSLVSFLLPFAFDENGEIDASINMLQTFGVAAIILVVAVWDQLELAAWKIWGKRDLTRSLHGKNLDYGGIIFLAFLILSVLLPLFGILLWINNFEFESLLNPIDDIWSEARSYSFGFVALPIFSPFTAGLTWWFLDSRRHRYYLRADIGLESFCIILAAITIFAAISMIWLGLLFPSVLIPFEESIPTSRELLKVFLLFAPYLIAFALVAGIALTVASPIANFLTKASQGSNFQDTKKPEPRSTFAMSAVSCISGIVPFFIHKTALLVAPKFPDFATTIFWADMALLVPLWMLTVLSGLNAVIREECKQPKHTLRVDDKSPPHVLGMFGMTLTASSIIWATSTIGTIA